MLQDWKIPYLAIKQGDNLESLEQSLSDMEEPPKVVVASVSAVADTEVQKFLRRQNIAVIAVDEAQVVNSIQCC